jgi:MFS family permease
MSAALPASRRFAALRHRDFTIFWGASIVSRVGTQMRDVALAWQIYLLTRSPLALGVIGAFRVLPVILLALWGGAAADSYDRRRMMIAAQTVLAVTSAIMAVVTAMGAATPAMLYVLTALSGAATAFDSPARQALVVNMLPEEDLANGLTLSILGYQVSTVVGPAIGGLLLAATSIEVIYSVDAVSFLAVIGALLVIRPRAGQGEPAARGGVTFEAVAVGLRFLRTKPLLVWLMVVDFLATFFAGALLLLPIFASEVFHVGERGLGLLAGAPAVGSLLASAWLSYRRPIRRQGLTVLFAIAAYGGCMLGFGLSTSFPLALLFLAASGAADAVSTVIRQVVRHTITPDELRGRMTSINMIFFMGGPQLGEVEAGILAQLTSVRVSVVSGGVACVLVALLVAALVPSLRELGRDRAAAA